MSFVLMLIGLLATGLGAILIGFGIPINEFSLGNTLILAGTVVAAGGLVIFAISRAVAQLSRIADILNSRPLASTFVAAPEPHDPSHPDLVARAVPRAAPAPARGRAEPPAPRTAEPRMQADPFEIPPEVEPARPSPAAGPRAAAPAAEIPDEPPAPRTPARPAPETPPRTGWRPPRPGAAAKPSVPEPRRPAPADNPFEGAFDERPEPPAAPPRREPSLGHTPEPARAEPVSVLKSGVVDGMAYTLYTDGSIEAELAQGVVRFGSIEELRNHLEKSA
jgi:hypothetical protein